MPPGGLEPTFPVSEQPQTNALDRAATGIGYLVYMHFLYYELFIFLLGKKRREMMDCEQKNVMLFVPCMFLKSIYNPTFSLCDAPFTTNTVC